MNKRDLRQLYRGKRDAIASAEKLKLDDLLLIRFQQLDLSGVTTLLTYWPKADAREPNTHLFSGYLRHMIPGLALAYPVTNLQTGTMNAVLIQEETVYCTNHYGLTEPKEGARILPADIDLVFVPLLVCDRYGQRVGYGKGFYDRYLAQCRNDVIKVGFSYFEPVEKIDDTHAFDVPLSFCVTPGNIYEF